MCVLFRLFRRVTVSAHLFAGDMMGLSSSLRGESNERCCLSWEPVYLSTSGMDSVDLSGIGNDVEFNSFEPMSLSTIETSIGKGILRFLKRKRIVLEIRHRCWCICRNARMECPQEITSFLCQCDDSMDLSKRAWETLIARAKKMERKLEASVIGLDRKG